MQQRQHLYFMLFFLNIHGDMCWSLSSAVSLYDFKIVIIVVRDAQLLLSILECQKKEKRYISDKFCLWEIEKMS